MLLSTERKIDGERKERENGIYLGSDPGVIHEMYPGLWAYGLDKSTKETWFGQNAILKCSRFLGLVLETNK